jgi:hypothetical protein
VGRAQGRVAAGNDPEDLVEVLGGIFSERGQHEVLEVHLFVCHRAAARRVVQQVGDGPRVEGFSKGLEPEAGGAVMADLGARFVAHGLGQLRRREHWCHLQKAPSSHKLLRIDEYEKVHQAKGKREDEESLKKESQYVSGGVRSGERADSGTGTRGG